MSDESDQTSSGVQQLIDKLRQEGIDAGQEQAEQILIDARKRAEEIISDAKEQADQTLKAAQEQARAEIQSVRDAFQLAYRDSMLALKENITVDFAQRVRQLVSAQLRDEAFLKQLILTVAAQSKPQDMEGKPIEILLPAGIIDINEPPQRQAGRLHEQTPETDPITRFVTALAAEQLRDGVTFKVSDAHESGIRVCIVKEDIELSLTDVAVSDLLLEYLLPRYRALIEGIVK
jgi:V/A-type H+-transporting ATPase subunit E